MSFELDDLKNETNSFLSRLQHIHTAVSLGGVETIICSPAQTSHVKLSVNERKRVGISNALLRLSVGIVHVDDLIADIEQALTDNSILIYHYQGSCWMFIALAS